MTSFIIEFEIAGLQWKTVTEATDLEAARDKFHRNHPCADILAIYPAARP